MSANMKTSSLQMIPLAALALSATPAQKERREHFDKAELGELAESIKGAGVLQAILVRPLTDGPSAKGMSYEVVAGERRVIAARKAGLEEIPASVRELTDDQVVELQLIENLQRADLHELAEAEGYEQLLKHGHSAEQIADKVGKSKGYVYARMKLLALGPAAREAFYRGDLSASTALLLARIPVASVQREACGKVTKPGYSDGPMSYRQARDFIEREYMLRLSEAPFDTKAEDLVKGAVACGRCPKNTVSQPELFGDVKGGSAGVCTDPTCFKAKREAGTKRQAEEARARGQAVITGHEAKKIAPHGEYGLQGGYARLDATCHEDAKGRTFKQLLGRGAKPTLLEVDGEFIQVVNKAEALKQAKEAGTFEPIPRSTGAGSSRPKDKVAEKVEKEFRRRLYLAIHAKAPKKLSREVLETLAQHEFDVIGIFPDEFLEAWGLKDEDRNIPHLDKLTEPQLCQMLWELLIVEEFHMSADLASTKLTNVAKSLGIDHAAIRKEIAAEQKAEKPAPAKASKKAKGKK